MTKHKVLVVCLFYCEYFFNKKKFTSGYPHLLSNFFHIIENHFYHHIAHVLGTTCYDHWFFLAKNHQKAKNYKLVWHILCKIKNFHLMQWTPNG
jgi:hypothetical protein